MQSCTKLYSSAVRISFRTPLEISVWTWSLVSVDGEESFLFSDFGAVPYEYTYSICVSRETETLEVGTALERK